MSTADAAIKAALSAKFGMDEHLVKELRFELVGSLGNTAWTRQADTLRQGRGNGRSPAPGRSPGFRAIARKLPFQRAQRERNFFYYVGICAKQLPLLSATIKRLTLYWQP